MPESVILEAAGLHPRIDRDDLQETEYGAYAEIGGVEIEIVDDEARIHLPVAFENDGEEDWGNAVVTVRDEEMEIELP